MNNPQTGRIFDIQKFSTIDGPGIRTTVFFKGCNLRCRWCHNPESQQAQPELLFRKSKCTGCGACLRHCHLELKACDLCGACTVYCPAHAREIAGRSYTADELLREILADKPFYRTSGGGVTFSGGECLLQADFLADLARKCKENGVHVAVDTAGCVPWESIAKLIPFADLFLFDVKAADEELHKNGTGVSNKIILKNLRRLSAESECEIIVRVPVIGGYNDSEEEMAAIAALLAPLRIKAVELLPYHAMGNGKYEALGRTAETFTAPSEAQIATFRTFFAERPKRP